MTIIDITGFTGAYPFTVVICDVTSTYCYTVATGIMSLPAVISVPPSLIGASQLLVKVIDNNSCEYFTIYTCVTPTPKPTNTPTPTPSMIVNCNCITFVNNETIDLNFGLIQCNGIYLTSTIYAGTTLYYCGKLPFADPGVTVTIGPSCDISPCLPVSPTPTPTLTPTPSSTSSVLSYLAQENLFLILQEDGGRIIIT